MSEEIATVIYESALDEAKRLGCYLKDKDFVIGNTYTMFRSPFIKGSTFTIELDTLSAFIVGSVIPVGPDIDEGKLFGPATDSIEFMLTQLQGGQSFRSLDLPRLFGFDELARIINSRTGCIQGQSAYFAAYPDEWGDWVPYELDLIKLDLLTGRVTKRRTGIAALLLLIAETRLMMVDSILAHIKGSPDTLNNALCRVRDIKATLVHAFNPKLKTFF